MREHLRTWPASATEVSHVDSPSLKTHRNNAAFAGDTTATVFDILQGGGDHLRRQVEYHGIGHTADFDVHIDRPARPLGRTRILPQPAILLSSSITSSNCKNTINFCRAAIEQNTVDKTTLRPTQSFARINRTGSQHSHFDRPVFVIDALDLATPCCMQKRPKTFWMPRTIGGENLTSVKIPSLRPENRDFHSNADGSRCNRQHLDQIKRRFLREARHPFEEETG